MYNFVLKYASGKKRWTDPSHPQYGKCDHEPDYQAFMRIQKAMKKLLETEDSQ
jgi:hypothetical protein